MNQYFHLHCCSDSVKQSLCSDLSMGSSNQSPVELAAFLFPPHYGGWHRNTCTIVAGVLSFNSKQETLLE